MKIFIDLIKKRLNDSRLLDIASIFVAIIVSIPIINFLIEGIEYIIGGNFSLGITGNEEVFGTLKLITLTSFFGGSLGTLNAWLLSNCEFKFRKELRICQLYL